MGPTPDLARGPALVDPLGLMAYATISNIPGQDKKKKHGAFSDGLRHAGMADKEETDPAIQDALNKAHEKFENRDDKKDPTGKCAEFEAFSKQAKEIRGDLSKQPGWNEN
ncbi:hypothetical protein [Sorangium sp. So ce406]|uniref:hypothetical protein n=1 Tax=Sorangium sp. So ce406 TaxID=3133311 RepID=UPI003F5C5AB5